MAKESKTNWDNVKVMLGGKEIEGITPVSWDEYHQIFEHAPARIDLLSVLTKYIEHVRQSEGIDFIDRLNQRQSSDVQFTDNELDFLTRISEAQQKQL